MVTVLLCVLLTSVTSALGDTVTIRQPDGPPCSEGRCFSLPECLINSDTCFTSFTTLEFQLGDHHTNGIEKFVQVKNVSDLTIIGKANGDVPARIVCSSRVGVAFVNVTNLRIVDLAFIGCGRSMPHDLLSEAMNSLTRTYLVIFEGMQAALLLVQVEHFNALHLRVTNSSGIGLLGWNVLGQSAITHSHFLYNNYQALSHHHRNPWYCRPDAIMTNVSTCVGGNAAFIFQDTPSCPPYRHLPYHKLLVNDTEFKHGVNLDYQTWSFPSNYFYPGGGLTVYLGQSSYNMVVWILNVSTDSNIGYTGANLVVYIHDFSTSTNSLVVVERTLITNGNADFEPFSNEAYSGGLYFWYGHANSDSVLEPVCLDVPGVCSFLEKALVVSGCTFTGNSAFHGAAMYTGSIISDNRCLLAKMRVWDSRFTNNTGILAILFTQESTVDRGVESAYSLNVWFSGSIFEQNAIPYNSDLNNVIGEFRGVLAFQGLGIYPKLQYSVIQNNVATGLHVEHTSVTLRGLVVIRRNTGVLGGGISIGQFGYLELAGDCSLSQSEYIPLNLTVEENTAVYGAGIYIQVTCLQCKSTRCFFYDIDRGVDGRGIHITMRGNSATVAGNSIYGGKLDVCVSSLCRTETYVGGDKVLEYIVDYPKNSSLTEIASEPQQVCFCEQRIPVCEQKVKVVGVYPGARFTVDAVGVGQLSGTVPCVALSKVKVGFTGVLGTQQDAQPLGIECGQLTFRVITSENYTELEVQVNLERESAEYEPLTKTIALTFNDCPLGFRFLLELGKCDCIEFLDEKGFSCDIDTLRFQRRSPHWLGYSHDKIMVHDNCPFDYCRRDTLWLSLHDTSAQCEFSRSGVLCGQCKPGLSSVFGTSQCKKCSNSYISLLFPFALAGFVLVLILIYCDLTVSKGTINGLILYANIVRVNHNVIFPAGESNILTVFIAWLNLDLGIETCFYNGMDEYGRTWLQFVFPVYIWTIVGVIIVVSWYSSLAVKIMGTNAVAVLATLFLLSYTKIQRTVLTALSLTVVPSHNGDSSVVWLYDGNIPYFVGKHAALFFTAVLVAVGFILPFTLLVLFGPFLQAKFSRQLMKLRLTPILDAFQGPYKDKFRCWSGVMLVLRSVLLFAFSVNALGSPRLNLLLTVSLMVLLLGFTYNVGTVYRQLSVNVLDSFYIVNLILLAAWTEFNRQGDSFKRNQAATAYVLVSTAFVCFLGILVYHIGLQIRKFMHNHNLHFPFHLRKEGAQAQDLQLEPMEDPSPVHPRAPTVTYVDIRARESLLES